MAAWPRPKLLQWASTGVRRFHHAPAEDRPLVGVDDRHGGDRLDHPYVDDWSDEEPALARFFNTHRSLAVLTGMAALAGCVMLFGAVEHAVRGGTPAGTSAQGLLVSRQLAEVVTDNLRAADPQGTGSYDKGLVRAHVESSLQDVNEMIRDRDPEMHRQLSSTWLTHSQEEAVLHSMRRMSDPRIQSLGRDLAGAVQEGSGDPALVRMHVSDRLSRHLQDILQLRAELHPDSPQQPGGVEPDVWVDPDNMQLMKSMGVPPNMADASQPGVAPTAPAARRLQTPVGGGAAAGIGGAGPVEQQGIMGQVMGLFKRLQVYVKNFPKLKEALLGQNNYETLTKCAGERWRKSDYPGLASCFAAYANNALDAVENTVLSSKSTTTLPPLQAAGQSAMGMANAAGQVAGQASQVADRAGQVVGDGVSSLWPSDSTSSGQQAQNPWQLQQQPQQQQPQQSQSSPGFFSKLLGNDVAKGQQERAQPAQGGWSQSLSVDNR